MSSRWFADGGRVRVALLGSTGSIGRQTVEVLEAYADRFEVVALAAGRNTTELEVQVRRLRPAAVAIADDATDLDMPPGVTRVQGEDALVELATRSDVDLVIVGTGGVVSLRPTLAALRAGKVVATANKETLVAGGHLVMAEARAQAAARARRIPETRWRTRSRGCGRSTRSTPPSGSVSSANSNQASPAWCSPPRADRFSTWTRQSSR